MKNPSKQKADAAIPKSEAMRRLSENQKKALELGNRAEHETGMRRELLQKQAREKAGR